MTERTPASECITFRPPDPGETAQKATVIGWIGCGECFQAMEVKLNVNRIAYSYCTGDGIETFSGCNTSGPKWNRQICNKIIANWAKSTPETEQHGEDIDQDANDDQAETAEDAPGDPQGEFDDTRQPETAQESPGVGIEPANDNEPAPERQRRGIGAYRRRRTG